MAKHKGPKRPPTQKKPPLTHFLCVPLVTPTSRPLLEASVDSFRNALSSSTPSGNENDETGSAANLRVVHPRAIRPVGALHLTLGVMSLDGEKLAEATEYLGGNDVRKLIGRTINGTSENSNADNMTQPGSVERPITPPAVERSRGPIEMQMKGLASMHAPNKTSILYIAPEDASGRFYPFCLALQKLFKDKAFLVEDNRALKLHATIVNTIYAKGRKRPAQRNTRLAVDSALNDPSTDSASNRASESRSDSNPSLKIDATGILEAYKDFVWADNVTLDRVAICEMGAKKILNENGKEVGAEYTEVASISLVI